MKAKNRLCKWSGVLIAVSFLLSNVLSMNIFPSVSAGMKAVNLITNGDFETGGNAPWTINQDTAVSDEAAYAGSYGLKLSGTGKETLAYQDITVAQNKDYVVRFWYKKIDSGVDCKITAGETNLTTRSNTMADWTHVELKFNSGANTTLRVNFAGNGTALNTVYLDNVEVIEYVEPNKNGLVTNGDFENGIRLPWTTFRETVASTEAAYAGNYGLKLSRIGTGYGPMAYQDITVEQNKDYVVRFWYKAVTHSAKIQIQTVAGSTVTTLPNGTITLNATEWTQVEKVVNSGDKTKLRLNFIDAKKDELVIAYLDNVVVEEYVEATQSGLITNGDFETGGNAPWTISQDTAVSDEAAYAGSYGLKLSGTGKDTLAYQDITVEENKDYVVRFWYKQIASGVDVKITAGTTNLTTKSYGIAQWTHVELKFNSGANTTLRVNFAGKEATLNTVYLDNVEVIEYVEPNKNGLVINGDFENGIRLPWTTYRETVASTEAAYAGNYGLKLSRIGTGSSPMAYQDITVEQNKDYVVRFWYKAVANSAKIQIQTVTGSTGTTVSDGTIALNATEWTQVEKVVNSGDKTKLRLNFIDAKKDELVIAYLDNVVVEEYVEATQNGLITNGDFETGGNAPWTINQDTAVSDEAAYAGSYGLKLSGNGGWGSLAYQDITVEQNKDYVLRFWYKAASNGSNVQIKAGDSNLVAQYYKAAYWQHVELQFNSGANTTLRVNFAGSGTNTPDVLYLDNVEVIEYIKPNKNGLVINGDLENGIRLPWNTYRETVASTDAAYAGDYGLKLSGNGGWGGLAYQDIMVEQNKDYVVRFWYKAVSNGVNFELKLGGAVAKKQYLSATAWTLVELEINSSDKTKLTLNFAGSGKGTPDVLYLDNIEVEEITFSGTEYLLANSIGKYKTQGRTSFVNDTLMLDYSLSGIEFQANCEGDVYVTFDALSIKDSSKAGGCYFTVIVDGTMMDRSFCQINRTGTTSLCIAKGLPQGKHTFAIYRQTEIQWAEIGIKSILVNGTLLSAPQSQNLYIEFIGDSSATGYGNLQNTSTNPGYPEYQDATKAYPYLIAKELNADFSNIAYSGIGAKYSSEATNMITMYPYLRYNYDRTTSYDFARQPDIVVIGLGANDIATAPSAAEAQQGFKELLDLVRSKNPNAAIVWVYGMTTQDANDAILAAVNNAGGESEGIYAVQAPTNTSGSGGNPSAEGHAAISGVVTRFIRDKELTGFIPGPNPPLKLTSFGVVNNRPISAEANLIKEGSFESFDNATWNHRQFLNANITVVEDSTAPNGGKSLYFNTSDVNTPSMRYFWVDVEKNTDYVFSGWVKGAFIAEDNRFNATFGVIDPDTGKFLTYEPYKPRTSTENLQLQPTAWDNEWHLRSVSFNSGEKTRVGIAVYGAQSKMWLDDIALFKVDDGIKYTSANIRGIVSPDYQVDHNGCADENSLIEDPNFNDTSSQFWQSGSGWKNGFLSITNDKYEFGSSLKYTESSKPEGIYYIKWVEVEPHTNYTFSANMKVLKDGRGKFVLMNDKLTNPENFLEFDFDSEIYGNDWFAAMINFNSDAFTRIGIAVADLGGEALIDNIRLFKVENGIDVEDTFVTPPDDQTDEPNPSTGIGSEHALLGSMVGAITAAVVKLSSRRKKKRYNYTKSN